MENVALVLEGGGMRGIFTAGVLDGFIEKLVVVLTHPKGYVEKAPWYLKASSIVYKKHPKLVDILKTRHEEYNQTLKELEKLEEEGKVFIIRPEKDLSILSKDIKKLNHNFEDGYKKAMKFSKNLH